MSLLFTSDFKFECGENLISLYNSDISEQKLLIDDFVLLITFISLILGNTDFIARTDHRAIFPAPTIPNTVAFGFANFFAAIAPDAAVLIFVKCIPSIIQ